MVQVRQFLGAQFAPGGFNIGINDGQSAGQTVDHAHVHVIPGDLEIFPTPEEGCGISSPLVLAIGRTDR